MKRLQPSAIIELTGTRDHNKQAAELDAMGIPYARRMNGALVVLQEAVDAKLMPVDHQPESDDFELVLPTH